MKSSNEIRELEKLSKGLAPKSGCRVCRLVLIAAVILFISSVLLAAFALGRSHIGVQQTTTPPVVTQKQSSERMQVLRDYLDSKRGSSTIIIGKPISK